MNFLSGQYLNQPGLRFHVEKKGEESFSWRRGKGVGTASGLLHRESNLEVKLGGARTKSRPASKTQGKEILL